MERQQYVQAAIDNHLGNKGTDWQLTNGEYKYDTTYGIEQNWGGGIVSITSQLWKMSYYFYNDAEIKAHESACVSTNA